MLEREELEAALNRGFFPRVESMGFTRDNRHSPGITYFRRRTASTMQLFAVLWANKGEPRFRILFTEAPLPGIEYGGKHLPAEDIFPGNFALPQGWLRPSPGSIWFAVRQTWWSRLVTTQRKDPDRAASEVLCLFPKIVAWWETKQKDPHLLVLPAKPLPEVPTHAAVFGRAVRPSWLQRFFARESVWTTGFFGTAVSFTLFLAYQAAPDGGQMLAMVVAGATGGAMSSWILLKLLWHLRTWINGGPFRKGDLVQVIAGPHAGRIAAVYEEWPSRNQVRIDLDEESWKAVKDVFSYIQLCRVKRAEPPAGEQGPNSPA